MRKILILVPLILISIFQMPTSTSAPPMEVLDLSAVNAALANTSAAVAVDLSPFLSDYNVLHFVWELHGVPWWVHHQIDCVITYESGWQRDVVSRTNDRGYWQINGIHWRRYIGQDIFDPWVNSEIAYQLWAERGGNFGAWSPPARYC